MKPFIKIAIYSISILTLSFCLVNYTAYKKKALETYITKHVVYITNDDMSSGGTGVQIIAPSGKTYILTNRHVCNGVQVGGRVRVSLEDKSHVYRNIIENSREYDLCLVEPLPQLDGMPLAKEQEYGIVYVVGHPYLMPANMVEGELLDKAMVDVFDHFIDNEHPCNLPKQVVDSLNPAMCLERLPAIESNITIFPGNSGSPVVDKSGEIVALVFAASGETHYGLMVPLYEIEDFLKNY